MQRTKKGLTRPVIATIIGIILIILSLTFWFYIVSPIVSLGTFTFTRPADTKTITNNTLTIYLGSVRFQQQDLYNRSRPVDNSMTLMLTLATTNPINLNVYVRDAQVFSFMTNATTAAHNIEFNSTKYDLFVANQTTPPTWLHESIHSGISASFLDAFTGGTTPYLTITNQNTTKTTNVTYFYTYSAEFRNSIGIPLLLFAVGLIMVIVYGITAVRRLIKRARTT